MAVEFCVRAIDEGDRRRGEFIEVQELPHKGWGANVCPPRFRFIQVLDMSIEEARSLLKRHHNEMSGETILWRVRSGLKINFTKFPSAKLSYFNMNTAIRLTRAQVVACAEDEIAKLQA
jgi:hypothetical protein